MSLGAPGLRCSTQGLFQLWHANSLLWRVGFSSLTRNPVWAPCIESLELRLQGSPNAMYLLYHHISRPKS